MVVSLSRYRTGYRLEHRIERLYAQHGWLTTRYPKSGRRLYPADVLAVKRFEQKTVIHLVECKNLSSNNSNDHLYIESNQIKKLKESAKEHNARALIAYSFPYQRPKILDASNLKSSGKMYFVGRDDGISFSMFLKSFNKSRST